MGIEPMPIWTEGPDAADPATGVRGLVEGIATGAAARGAATGGGVTIASCSGSAPELGDKTDVGMMVGPLPGEASGWGGTAVLATLMGAGIGSGGGVGGYMSGAGAGFGAGAALAWSLAPQPRQNLYRSWFSLPQREQVITRDPPRESLVLA